MLIDYEFAFYLVMVISIVVADYVTGYYIIDLQSFIQQQPFGLFFWVKIPDWLLVILGMLAIDLADYLYHRLSHQTGFLWRLHAVHHTDKQLDVSTTLRGHPFGLVLSNFWKIGFALVLGLPLWVIGLREVFIFPLIFLQHANVSLPAKLETALGKVVVTPVIHRVHHSIIRDEHDNNYGQALILWDKLFGTYREPWADRPAIYGVKNCEGEKYQSIDGMLLMPLHIDLRQS
jgi:sterol desaturase/sphingolipid hydroxylase (fatty acid hydroxylase superfamily)